MATISLGQFERDHGINRGTVQKQALAMGFSTSDGLNDEALQALQAYYKVGPFAPKATAQQPEATGSEVVRRVEVQGSLAGRKAPEMSVYTFNVPGVLAESFEDPLALASQFLEFGDQLLTEMDNTIGALHKRAADTQLAAQLIKSKTNAIAAKQRQSDIQAAVSTAFIERDMAEIKRQAGV